MKPLVFPLNMRLDEPTSSDKEADGERLRRACGRYGYGDVSIPVDLLRKLPSLLRKRQFVIDPLFGYVGDGFVLVEFNYGKIYGLAIDIGTTNISLSLLDMISGERVISVDVENPQIVFGEDVLSRVHESMMGKDLHAPLRDGLNKAIRILCGKADVAKEGIVAVAVAGNTIMTHFFMDLPVDYIPVAPYVPVVHHPGFLSNREVKLAVHPDAIIYVFPNAGSYVGGDIVSGILSVGIHREEEAALFVDVGTNAEIVLGCSEWLIAAAGAAGPALEGGISPVGRRAVTGSIHHLRIDRKTKEIITKIVGGGEPLGLCGSGMIDLISELFHAGIIDQRGRFVDGSGKFTISKSPGRELAISEAEIANFLRTKAAMATALSVLVKSVGLTFGDIRRFFVAGALGCGIDVEKARNIGMLPPIEGSRFVSAGNASLRGAEMLLLNRDFYRDIKKITGMITYRELNEDGEFMREFEGARFISDSPG